MKVHIIKKIHQNNLLKITMNKLMLDNKNNMKILNNFNNNNVVKIKMINNIYSRYKNISNNLLINRKYNI